MKKLITILLLFCFAKPEFSNIETYQFNPEPKKLDFNISENGIEMIKRLEGFSEYSYWDNGSFAIGYGTHGKHIKKGQKITRKKAQILMQYHLNSIALEMKDNALNLSKQSQIDAIFSICYNRGVPAFKKSHLYKLLKSPFTDYRDIQSEFTSYYEYLYRKYPKNTTYQDLYYRRVRESMLFFNLQ
jgi:GH24 family phage-related lysozyme (muramidase)